MRFTGTAQDINGHPLAGLVDITFAIDAESIAGLPPWLETQNVQADKKRPPHRAVRPHQAERFDGGYLSAHR